MYGNPAMTCFKYQVYVYGSEAITYLSAILWVVIEPALSHQAAPTPQYRQPSPHVYGSITFTHLKENFSMVKLPYLCKKSKGPCMVGEPSHVKQLSLNHVCEIGLRFLLFLKDL
jgi:hypothetical protein